MLKVFEDTREMDAACRQQYGLSEEVMMENAAAALEKEVQENGLNPPGLYINRAAVLILAGKGNNGADGYALARRLISKNISVTVCCFGEPSTEMCKLQKVRAEKSGVVFIEPLELDDFIAEKSIDLRVVVDCIFGSGFHGELPADAEAVIEEINSLEDVYRIACDVPTGMFFNADVTVTMGALKSCLFTDNAKDHTGKIILADLGISRSNFEHLGTVHSNLLEEKDLSLPFRKKQNVNKGTFGHAVFVSGDKKGASVIAATAALNFGAGLATVVSDEELRNPYEIMCSKNIPENAAAICFGPGAGISNKELFSMTEKFLHEKKDTALVLDADVCYMEEVKNLLKERSDENLPTVITPHPKEFASLLKICGLGEYSVQEVLKDKFTLASKFCDAFPEVVLVVKGAAEIICVKQKMKMKADIYINLLGNNSLAKAGSGDVLAGLTAALLAQKQSPCEAAVNASLAHKIAAGKIENNFALTPFKLIEKVAQLKLI